MDTQGRVKWESKVKMPDPGMRANVRRQKRYKGMTGKVMCVGTPACPAILRDKCKEKSVDLKNAVRDSTLKCVPGAGPQNTASLCSLLIAEPRSLRMSS